MNILNNGANDDKAIKTKAFHEKYQKSKKK